MHDFCKAFYIATKNKICLVSKPLLLHLFNFARNFILARRVARGGGLGGLAPPPPPNRSAREICTVIKQLPLTGPIVYFVLYLTFYV